MIFINGVQSAGKSTLAKGIAKRASTFRVVSGDELIRKVPADRRESQANALFTQLLDEIDSQRRSSNLIVDAALDEQQVREAQERFAGNAIFILVRVNEADRARRERSRHDRRLAYEFRQEWHEIAGPDELYDLVLDSSALNPAQCVSRVIRKVRSFLGHD